MAAEDQKYLGLPAMIGRNKQETFSYIKDAVWSRISNWNKRCLSRAGKEILLKSVAQAVPNYAMSFFLLPVHLCQDLEKMMNSF